MKHIACRIAGIPYGQDKTRGDTEAPGRWTTAVIEQTQNLPKISEACLLKVTFVLPSDKFLPDYPFGSDLDNLLKRFMDALNATIFNEAKGKDSCVIQIIAMKTRAEKPDEAGALLEVLPIRI
jgi:Holliday junction resolvase RusA-like endonuclease